MLLEQALLAAERVLGPGQFRDAVGRFWKVPATRPYMRARVALAQCLWSLGCRPEAVEHLVKLLALIVVVVFFVAVVSLLLGIYNDLARRLEKLKGLQADIRTMESRRKMVKSAVTHRVDGAMRHESKLRQPGVDSRRRGRMPLVAGNANGLPNRSVGTAEQGLANDVTALGQETQAYERLHRDAEEFNALLQQIPVRWIAPAMGFRPWRMYGWLRR